MGWTLSIDFGTTDTAAAYALDGHAPFPVRLSDAVTMPSAVLAGPHDVVVGVEAVRMRRLRPECYLESPKLELGQDDGVLLGDDEVPVTELVGSVLRHVARTAAGFAGSDTPTRVVLTHPHEWAEHRRAALRASWEATGIPAEEVQLVSEPVAAATWLAGQAELAEGATVGVFDYGGGSCEVAVLRRTSSGEEPWEVLGHDGLTDLGGAAIDTILFGWVQDSLLRLGHAEVVTALNSDLEAQRTLQDEVRLAKEAMTQWPDRSIPVAVGPYSLSLSITEGEFDHLVRGEVAKACALTERVLRRAGVAAEELRELYLTGGSSHLRPVQAALGELLGGRRTRLGDPKLVVALGAHAAPSRRPVERTATPVTAPVASVPATPPASIAGVSPATRRLLQAQPALAAALATLPDGPRLLDDHAVLTAVLAVPGLLEEIVARPARLAELGADRSRHLLSGYTTPGELLEVPDDDATAVLPVRNFLADAPAWQRAADDAEWRQRLRESCSGLAWAANAVAAWNGLPLEKQTQVLGNPEWHPGHADAEYSWLYTEEESGSVWIASTARSTPQTPATPSTQSVGFPRPLGLTPQQSTALAVLEPLGLLEGRERFLRACLTPSSPVQHHCGLRLHVGDRWEHRPLYLSKHGQPPYVLLPKISITDGAPGHLILTPDVVDSVRSKTYLRDNPTLLRPAARAIVRTTVRPGASDPASGSELHLFAEGERDLAGLIARHLRR